MRERIPAVVPRNALNQAFELSVIRRTHATNHRISATEASNRNVRVVNFQATPRDPLKV
jgi:hypothetical protein